jgi:diguanylate cyclase (GGDEF)-like protein
MSITSARAGVDKTAMRPPLSKRIGFADRSVETRADRALMARSLMYVFALGGCVAVAALATSHGLPRLGATVAFAWVAALILLGAYDAVPVVALQALLLAGIAAVDWSIAASPHHATALATLLVAPAVYSVYFFTKRAAVLHLAAIVAGYAVAADVPASEALLTGAGLIAATGLVGLHRASANRLIARLSDVARTDPLTGLLNRRGFEQLLDTELERSRRSGRPLSLVVGDLDHFKQLNDRFGHGAGDSALERLSVILNTAKRRIDTAARIGGEEFAVVLPDSDQHAAYILAERMRREVRETFASDPSRLTISLGVATFPVHATTAESLIARADESLYAAKALGRDRSALYSEETTVRAIPRDGGHSRTVLALAEVLDAQQAGRDTHSQTVARYAAAIARELGMPDELVDRVHFGGVVHDIGKIGVPDAILQKPGWLNAEDWLELRRHPEIGAQILSSAQMHDVSEWVRAHHERPDGTGYPDGLEGHAIPLEARILAVADAYEAMTSDRVYRAALSADEARDELLRASGTQFDRHVVDAFLRLLDGASASQPLRLAR